MPKTDSARRRGAGLVLAGLLAVGLGACGVGTVGAASPPAGPGKTAPHGTLCESIASLDGLVVTRTDAFPENGTRFSFPATVTVDHVREVREVATELCGLPAFPSGMRSCPIDRGIGYKLAFAASDHRFPAVTIDPMGCEGTSGGGLGVRWLENTPKFWASLGQAMGIPAASRVTFAGS